MGCDIQLFCEGYIKQLSGEHQWINIDHWFRTDGWAEFMINDEQGFDYVDLIEGRRDYGLFYLLAGVRGIDEENSYLPIAKAKGIPPQMDSLIRNYYREFYEIDFTEESIDCHHISYLSLKELKDSGYGEIMRLKGWVDESDYNLAMELHRKGQKFQLDFEDIKELNTDHSGLVLKEWDGYINLNLTYMIERMEALKKERRIISDEDIRIVFWFDN